MFLQRAKALQDLRVPPGNLLEALKESRKGRYTMPVSINQPARKIGVPPGRISAIVNGKRAITANTALRLAKYFGTSSELWLGLQRESDLRSSNAQSG